MSAVPHTANMRDSACDQAQKTAWCQAARVLPQPAPGSNRCIPVNQLDTRKKAFEAALKLAMFE